MTWIDKIVCRCYDKNFFKDPGDDLTAILRMQCLPCQWQPIITSWCQLWYGIQKMAMQQNLLRIVCFNLHQKQSNLILITSDFIPMINPNWILILGMTNVLYVQWTRMRLLMNCPMTLLKQYFISLPLNKYFFVVHALLVNKSTRCWWRNGSTVNAIMDIMIGQALLFLRWWKWKNGWNWSSWSH